MGLTLLDTALLENSKRLYDKEMDIDFEALKVMKENLKSSSYSIPLKHIILNLVEGDPRDRIKLAELYSWLRPHEDQIVNL